MKSGFTGGYLAQIRDCVPPGRSGEIAVFDKAYVDFAHLNNLNKRCVFWVTRSKENLCFEVMEQQLSEEEIQQANYMRERKIFMGQQPVVYSDCRIGLMYDMSFITNNMEWSPPDRRPSNGQPFSCSLTSVMLSLKIENLTKSLFKNQTFSKIFTQKISGLSSFLKNYGISVIFFQFFSVTP